MQRPTKTMHQQVWRCPYAFVSYCSCHYRRCFIREKYRPCVSWSILSILLSEDSLDLVMYKMTRERGNETLQFVVDNIVTKLDDSFDKRVLVQTVIGLASVIDRTEVNVHDARSKGVDSSDHDMLLYYV